MVEELRVLRVEEMERTVEFTLPACLRLCLLSRFQGSRENWWPPAVRVLASWEELRSFEVVD